MPKHDVPTAAPPTAQELADDPFEQILKVPPKTAAARSIAEKLGIPIIDRKSK
jgi:hypothetical protein